MPSQKKSTSIVTIAPLFLARREAAAFLSLSESHLESMAARGDIPPPRKLSPGRVAWLVDDLIVWGQARPVSDLLPPSGSGYGRAGRSKKKEGGAEQAAGDGKKGA